MALSDIAGLTKINQGTLQQPEGVYIGDLLSCVMANIAEGSLWLTTQTNMNVIAIGHLHELAGIIFVEGMEPDEATIAKADEIDIPLYTYDKDAYGLALKIHDMGLDHVL